MRWAVVVFPGSNCDRDAEQAIRLVTGDAVDLVWHDAEDLSAYDAIVLPGGFSYGDYLRAGAIARFSPVVRAVAREAERGKPVIGICNGFQILTEAGLLPGALQWNRDLTFICEPEPLVVENATTAFTRRYTAGQVITLPIAHGEGNYYADDATLTALEAHHQVVLRYQHNPNGSCRDIAGITNEAGNVMGMMPHPERAVEALLGGTDGLGMFESLMEVCDGAYA